MPGNPRISELMKDDLAALSASAASTAEAKANAAAAAAVAVFFKGKADTLPTAADFIGQLFVRTGSTSPGLYVSTGTTTPGWKAVSHAS